MGRGKKNKARRRSGEAVQPGQVAWTPLEQVCGCVVDWGRSGQSSDPQAFIDWCVGRIVLNRPCPWHEEAGGGAGGGVVPGHLLVQPPGSGVVLNARRAEGSDVALGRELTARLRRLVATVEAGDLALLDTVPAGLRDWLLTETASPARAWLQHELTEILLNRGRAAVPREMLADLPRQLSEPAGPQPDSAACNVCSVSAAHGGILCTCGHDWSCHPGRPCEQEPCSHCDCKNMQDPM
ncbi:hypothetical protein [Streptomyces sp. NBC_01465]|uniref:hypothetical protein n=1 Tax=Streptomyces sp. NBC_01465 TaxID=2903878 RepID=UPI002E35717E|nr:hypothetical protein [Streptomyces sp. NBC_01465]